MKAQNHLLILASLGLLVLPASGQTSFGQTASAALESYPSTITTNLVRWFTNKHQVLRLLEISSTNSSATNSALFRAQRPDRVHTEWAFGYFQPDSLSQLIWTNFIAHTNGRDLRIWSERRQSGDELPVVKWNTNSLLWGMKGLTALAPCWELSGGGGQSPITALTRRHGYTRGHGMGAEGFTTNRIGLKVWFLTENNRVVQVKIKQSVVRVRGHGGNDYTIVLFDRDLPDSIEPMRVTSYAEVQARHPEPAFGVAPRPIFRTEQNGHVSSGVPPLVVSVGKGGDSGSPDMLPLPGELIFFGGRSTSGPTPAMQADMDELCRMEKLDPCKYQMQWVGLARYPSY